MVETVSLRRVMEWSRNCLFKKICLELSGCVVYLPISSRRVTWGHQAGHGKLSPEATVPSAIVVRN